MRNSNSLLTVGVILVIMPVLGFPASWKNFFLVLIGLFLCAIAFAVRGHRTTQRHRRVSHKKESAVSAAPFVENQPMPIMSAPEAPAVSVSPTTNDQTPQI